LRRARDHLKFATVSGEASEDTIEP